MKLTEALFHHKGEFHWHKAQFSMTFIFTWIIVFCAIYAAVKLPASGSQTISPGSVNDSTLCCISSSTFCHG